MAAAKTQNLFTDFTDIQSKKVRNSHVTKQNSEFMTLPSANSTPEKTRKSRVTQTEVPTYSLDEALRIAQAISDNYAKHPTKPLNIAKALDLSPGSSRLRMLIGASSAYGLTEGSYSSDTVSLTELGRRIVSPTIEGMEQAAKREALLKPRIIREFLTKYNNNRIPADKIAKNVLEEMGVPADSTEQTLHLVLKGAKDVGLISNVKDYWYADLDGVSTPTTSVSDEEEDTFTTLGSNMSFGSSNENNPQSEVFTLTTTANNRVFITHGKNTDIVNQLKELLTFGSFVPVVAAEHETISKPVPDKVMDDMRSCYAAIIHVGQEIKLLDQSGQEHVFLNQNVLIEIGAAMALYGRRFILLVERGATLPSNLQGLYEVRYEGNKLDYEATMKLLKAFNDFKS